MKQVSILLAWGATAIVAALAWLNWPTLMVDAPLNLVVVQIQAPLGVVLLGMAGVLVALFFVAWLSTRIDSLLETRRLQREVLRVQDLADKAEASRVENLHRLVATEFRLLNERLSAVAAASAAGAPVAAGVAAPGIAVASAESRPLSITDIVSNRLYP